MTAIAESSVLDPVRHARLLDDLDHVCALANVKKSYVRESMTVFCDSTEVDYVVNFRVYREESPGLLLVGKKNSEERCMAIAGALIRNFIDARVITLTALLDAADAKAVPEPTVMIIPNLFQKSYGKQYSAWQLAIIYDILLNRWTTNRPTVLALEDLTALQQAYGLSFADHLKKYRGQP
jgi:hypothetical protein